MALCFPDRPKAFSQCASHKKMLARYNIMLQSLPHSSALHRLCLLFRPAGDYTLGLQKWVSVCLRGSKPSLDNVSPNLCLECNTVLLGHFFDLCLEVAGS